MSEIPSASRLEQSLLEFLKVHRWDKLECHCARRLEIQEKQASHGYHELVTKVNNLFKDILDLDGSGDETDAMKIPECIHKRALCDLHHQICLDFVCGSEALRDHRIRSCSPKTESGLTGAGREAGSGHNSHLKFCSSHTYTEEAGQQLNDEFEDDSDDDLEHDVMENVGGDSGNDEDDGDGSPSSVDALDVAEYDLEEVFQKYQVSQRRRQCIVDEDDVRTLVSVSDLDDCAGSMGDSMQNGTKIHAVCMTPKPTDQHLGSSPFTPKNHPSFLQHLYDTHSARTTLFTDQFRLSPNHRTLRTITTLSADPSHEEVVEVNEKAVRQLIMALSNSKGDSPVCAKRGYVYAFRDNELPLIKFGRATNLEARKASIESACGFVKNLSLVAAVKVNAHKQLEAIIHQDLAPHRRFFDCVCGESKRKKGFTRHQEWFQIDDNTALRTLQLWADFVERQPWEQTPWPQKGTHLKSNWHDKLLTPSIIEPSETHDSHGDRIKRWRKFLDIPLPESEIDVPTPGTGITNRPIMSPLTVQSKTQRRSPIATPTENAAPDYTPSKPPRTAIGDMAEEVRSVKIERSSSESLKQASRSIEPFSLTSEQDPHSVAQEAKINLPHRPFPFRKNTPMFHFSANPTASNIQTESASNGQNVCVAGKQSIPIVPSMDSQQSNDGVVSSAGNNLRNSHPPHNEDRPSDKVSSPSHEILKSATMMNASPLMQSIAELATCLLAKEVRPLPAKAISADIWQFRWPLACSIAFALHSPHIPAGLSLLMWSVFLPFFVAELRGWAVGGQAWTRS